MNVWHKNIWMMLASFCILGTFRVSAQNVVLKTNLPYWATTTPNLAAEARIAPKWTLDFSLGYNPFTFSDNKKIRHIAVQPEARYWLCAPFAGHFIGANMLYSHYNAGGVNLPFGLWSGLEQHRFQGNLGAVGLVYGYSWMLPGKRWNIEAAVGLGVGYTRYDKYDCAVCGSKIGDEEKWLFMPTKFSISVVYNLF